MQENRTVGPQDSGQRPVGDAPPVLEVLGLEKTYLTGFWRRPCAAVGGVSFVVPRGTVFALLGHNGAGKTTTMKAILDLVHADAGTIRIFGRDHRDHHARDRIGYLPEGPYFYEHLTGRELLDFYGTLYDMPRRRRRARIEECLAGVGMTRHAATPLRKYSKGMRQRLGVAQAILNEPELLILDEPMSGLDPLGRHEVRMLLQRLKEGGTTILLSSHIVPDVEQLADGVGILRRGRMLPIYDLKGASRRQDIEVVLPAPPPELAGGGTLAGCRCERTGAGDEVRIVAADQIALSALLEACNRAGIEARSIRRRETGLEELFLEALQEDAGGAVARADRRDRDATGAAASPDGDAAALAGAGAGRERGKGEPA